MKGVWLEGGNFDVSPYITRTKKHCHKNLCTIALLDLRFCFINYDSDLEVTILFYMIRLYFLCNATYDRL